MKSHDIRSDSFTIWAYIIIEMILNFNILEINLLSKQNPFDNQKSFIENKWCAPAFQIYQASSEEFLIA